MLLDRLQLCIDDRAAVNAPNGNVIASGSIRKPIPMVGRLETMVKPMRASCSARTARFAPSVRTLSLGKSVPSTSETTSAMRFMNVCYFN